MSFKSTIGNMVRMAPRKGINELVAPEFLSPEFTPDAENVYYENGYLVQMKGAKKINSTAITGTPSVNRIHQYRRNDGQTDTLLQGDGNIYRQTGANSFSNIVSSDIASETYRFSNGLN